MKHYLRSTLSNGESMYRMYGIPLVGEPNHITALIKFIGKYHALCAEGKPDQIKDYCPGRHLKFNDENHGYTVICDILRKKYPDKCVGRRFVKALSRKWAPQPVVISFDAALIITEILEYVRQHKLLFEVCKSYMEGVDPYWSHVMPVQYSFIECRHGNFGKDYDKAGDIIIACSHIHMQDLFRG